MKRVQLTISCLALGILLLVVQASQPTHAAGPWYVAPGGDDGHLCTSTGAPCATINGAIGRASLGDTVYVAVGTYTGTADQVVLIDKDITLSGGWDAGFGVQSGVSTIDGEGTRRGITVNSDVTTTVEYAAIQNGSAGNGGGIYSAGAFTLCNSTVSGNTATGYLGGGSGIYNDGGSVTVLSSTVSANAVVGSGSGGAIYNVGTMTVQGSTVSENYADDGIGGIYNGSSLILNDSEVSSNTANASCGGIWNNSGSLALRSSIVSGNTSTGKGGGICNWDGSTLLDSSTVSDNTAGDGGGIDNSGILILDGSAVSGNAANQGGGIRNSNSGTLTLSDSTINDNTATVYGGGIDSLSGIVTLNNSTVSGNTMSGGPHAHGAGIRSSGTALTLDSSTVSNNTTSGLGGGVFAESGTVIVRNTLLTGNTALSGGPDCSGAVYSDGYNLIGDSSGCSFWSGITDLVDVSASIGPLVGHPGYHPLSPGSAAVDVIPPGDCSMATDQRGINRPQGSACDIGAYEYAIPDLPAAIHAVAGTPQRTPPFSTFGQPLQVVVLDGSGTPVDHATVTFSAPSSGPSGTFADSGDATTGAVTGETGIATAQPFRAGGLTGSYLVTATVEGVAAPATFSLANVGWYVSPDGSDASDCQTPASACATVNGALGKAGFVAGDTVLVASGTYTGSDSAVVLLGKDARLLGGWDELFTTQSGVSFVDCERELGRQGVVVHGDVMATIDRFAVRNAYANSGAGLRNSGTLVLENSSVSDNESFGTGGGISNDGSLTLRKCVVNSNGSGVGVGGIQNNGILVLDSSMVRDNTADGFVGGIRNDGSLTVKDSVISGNRDTGLGGGVGNFGLLILDGSAVVDNEGGGGLYNHDNGTMRVLNSTVSGNHDAGVDVFGGTVSLKSSTVGGNAGSGIYNGSGTVTLHNSIVAGNGPDCSGTVGSLGYNLVGDTSGCTFTPAIGDLTNLDAKLGPLEGSPGYYPLLPGSPAIDAGDPAGCTDHLGVPVLEDQRSAPRVGRCDMGAYEVGLTARKEASGSVLPGSDIAYMIVLGNEASSEMEKIFITDALPTSVTYVPGSFSSTSGTGGEYRGIITWNGTLGAGQGATISFRATVDEAVPGCSSIINRVRVAGRGFGLERQATSEVQCVCNLAKHTSSPVLSAGPSGSWDSDDVWGPAILQMGNVYMMWYTADDGSSPSQIGLATSADGINWIKSGGNPVLSPSQSWESEGIVVGSVIHDGTFFRMWYAGYDGDWVARIGYASSPDGVTWSKLGSNPILDVGASGGWDGGDVRRPAVLLEDATYHMWYEGHDGMTSRIGHATSTDGVSWTRDTSNPVLDVGQAGYWDWLDVYGPSAVKVEDKYMLWYSGETLPQAWQTGYALSTDGSHWMRDEKILPEGSPGAFDAAGADDASVLLDGTKFEIWYSGHDGSRYTIGYATAEQCDQLSVVEPANAIYLPVVLRNWNAQPCRPYYSERFDDPASGWPLADSSDRRYDYVNGEYQIWVKQPSQGWMVTPGAKATDFAVAVSARRASGARGAYGVIFGINENWSEYYEIIVDMKYYSVWKNDNGSWTALQNWTQSSHIGTGTTLNRLKVIRDGTTIAFYANNQHLTTVTDGSFTGFRRIGLVAYSPSDGPLDARFDDFALYPASCGIGAAEVGFEMGLPEVQHAPAPPGLDSMPSNRERAR